jgi:hypothetical protein
MVGRRHASREQRDDDPTPDPELAARFDIEHLGPAFYDDPFPAYRALREYEPVKRLPTGAVFLTRIVLRAQIPFLVGLNGFLQSRAASASCNDCVRRGAALRNFASSVTSLAPRSLAQ